MDKLTKLRMRSADTAAGLTLIELLVTLAILAILATLAAPSFRDFIVRGKMSTVTNDFTASVLRARNAAVSHNICTVMCMSSSAGSSAPKCTSTDTDWQVGWIVFLNPDCDASNTNPAAENVIVARVSSSDDIFLQTQNNRKTIQFNARGNPSLSAASRFDVIYKTSSDPMTIKYGVNICLDSMGRGRVIPGIKTCNTYN